jgi:geranylgeranyl diphosphate synthase type I
LRPAFCYWGWRGAGGPSDGPDGEAVVRAATALELFQAAALVHDDVMDDSDSRRGMPSVHRRFAELHRGAAWLGTPERFGQAAAILLGDLCLVWSDELLTACGLPTAALARGRPVFDRMRTELMGGQYLDMLEQARAATPGDAAARARRVIRFKSAKYTIEHPLLLGGSLAGGPPELLASYSAFGLPLGEAFQLRDDVLGVFGDPSQTGKPAGDALREGKRTMLVAHAVEHSDEAQADLLRRHLGDPRLDPHGIDVLRQVIVDTGAVQAVEQLIDSLVDEAAAALEAAPLDEPTRGVLGGLVDAATARHL